MHAYIHGANGLVIIYVIFIQVNGRRSILFSELKEEVRRLINQENKFVARLELIDDIEHLGLGHHFGEEIMHALTSISAKTDQFPVFMKEDLHAMALLFRLLRQHGLHISQGIYMHIENKLHMQVVFLKYICLLIDFG